MKSKYIKAVSTALALLFLLSSCDEEFPINSSHFSSVTTADKSIVYTGKRAGEFKIAAQNIDWMQVEKLIVKGHINQNDMYLMRNYLKPRYGAVKELNFRDADILEGTFPDRIFGDHKQLERFVYPQKMITTGNIIYDNCHNLKEIIIPEEVEILGSGLFEPMGEVGYKHIMPKEKYAIPPMVKKLDKGAYMYYPYSTISIPDNVNSIEIACFKGSKLETFTFPQQITIVNTTMFQDCKSLKSVQLHNKITEIKDYAFYDCTSLEELIMPESITKVEKQFLGNTKALKKIVWSPNITELPEEALHLFQMEEFTVPQSITSLGRMCFSHAQTKRYYFHKGITKLGEGLFVYNSSNPPITAIEELHVAWKTPIDAGRAFEPAVKFSMSSKVWPAPDFSKVKLYVPKGSKAAYQNAEGWKKFGEIIEE